MSVYIPPVFILHILWEHESSGVELKLQIRLSDFGAKRLSLQGFQHVQ